MIGLIVVLLLLFSAMNIYNICTDKYFIQEELAVDILAQAAIILVICFLYWLFR